MATTTDPLDVFSNSTAAGLLLAGLSLGAVYALSLGRARGLTEERGPPGGLGWLATATAVVVGSSGGGGGDEGGRGDHNTHQNGGRANESGDRSGRPRKRKPAEGRVDSRSRAGAAGASGLAVRRAKGGRKRRGKGAGESGSGGKGFGGDEGGDRDGDGMGQGDRKSEAEAEDSKGQGQGHDMAKVKPGPGAEVVPFPRRIPGDFERTTEEEAPSARTTSEHASGAKTQKRKKQKKQGKQRKQGQGQGEDKGGEQDKAEEVGSETDREADAGRTPLARVGGSAIVSRLASGGDAVVSFSGATEEESSSAQSTRLVSPSHSQPRAHAPLQIRPSLSFDTDSSWTHVDRRRREQSKSTDGEAWRIADSTDVTNSDLASTTSDSPVAERIDVRVDVRGLRADVDQRTLAEKLVPRPTKTGVDDMLERPEFPALARVMRVQPPSDATPVPGFSWEDYGDVVEDSVLVHDADEEDEGEWGIVKRRQRTRPPQTATASASVISSTSSASAASETMTKKQRQNARKRELVKSAKAEAEATRLQGLAKHQRELERLRIIEQSRQSGGMQATVDDRGKLVWE